jgi:hypothetical protein
MKTVQTLVAIMAGALALAACAIWFLTHMGR